jgi:hypothetical protein
VLFSLGPEIAEMHFFGNTILEAATGRVIGSPKVKKTPVKQGPEQGLPWEASTAMEITNR